MVVDVIITTGAGVGAGGSSKANGRGTGTGIMGSSSGAPVAPQQQPRTSAGISRSWTTRGGATNGSTNASRQANGAADRVTAHALIASVARSFPPLGGGGGGGGSGRRFSKRRRRDSSPYLSRAWTSNASASPRTAMTKFAMT